MDGARALPPRLQALAERIEGVARERGLDFFELRFQMLDAKDVNAMAAYGGFPVRYPSWRFGMEYERLEKSHAWGLSRIYELVINADPTWAYLVRTNSDMEQKLVMAHVCGHADFFKHNVWFQPTDRHMLDRMAASGVRVRRWIDLFGHDVVESFLDRALSLDSLCDPFLPLREHLRARRGAELRVAGGATAHRSLDELLGGAAGAPASPALPTFDVIGLVAERAPLAPWQRELLRLVREEAYYFLPQRTTKIMNEGWASYWHSAILTSGVLDGREVIDFADCHSGATAAAPGQLNPYKLGLELFRCAQRRGLDLFRLRRVHNDASLIDELVDEEFAARNRLFTFATNGRTGRSEISGRDFQQVKQRLLQELAAGGLPRIEVVDDDGEGHGELLLVHHHDGRDLALGAAAETLRSLAGLWGAPVVLLTQEGESGRRLWTDGQEFKTSEVALESAARPGA